MTRYRRTRILVLSEASLRQKLAREVLRQTEVTTLQSPQVGLVLTTVRESSRRSLFHLGEVLVAEAKVSIGGVSGLGILRGSDLEAAYDLAVIDAAFAATLPTTSGWEAELEQAETLLEQVLDREQASLSETKVDFETFDQGGH